MKSRKKKFFVFFAIVVLLPIVFLIGSHVLISQAAKNKTFDDVTALKYNKVGLLLGTSKYQLKGGINLYFKYRVQAAVTLFNAHKIDYILVSGDNGTPYYNEPKAIKDELLKAGIPENKIVLDYAGFRTLDSVIRANRIFGQASITVISQKFHNERAIYLASQQGIDAVGFNAEDVTKKYGLKTRIREYFARSKAVLDVLFHTQPKYLGEKIEIK